MTTRILTGTYNSGYTLSASYSALSIAGTGVVNGVTATGAGYVYDGGDAVRVTFVAPVNNAGTLLGGLAANGQPAGGKSIGGSGGTGGAGADLTAGGSVNNTLSITGGQGGSGGQAYGGGHGGAGGTGVLLGGSGSVNNTGHITGGNAGGGAQGTHGGSGGTGGNGVQINAVGTVTNYNSISGGSGGNGAYGTKSDGAGGTGGAAIDLSGGGDVLNTVRLAGGGGGNGASPFGAGGYGGAGVTMGGVGTVTNQNYGYIFGGAAGTPGKYYFLGDPYPVYGPYGLGGAGVALAAGGVVTNTGHIYGGSGFAYKSGDAGVYLGGAGTVTNAGTIGGGFGGGTGVILGAGGTVANTGKILGGLGGGIGVVLSAGGTLANHGGIAGGAVYTGAGALGVLLVNGGVLSNTGSISGAAGVYAASYYAGLGVSVTAGGSLINGSKTATSAAIFGYVAIKAGSGSHATVTNFGTIAGGIEAVEFASAGDRLIAEAGSAFTGYVLGGSGTLETAGGAETVTGLGGTATMSGAVGMTFVYFGTYQIDAAAAWTLTGANMVNTADTLIDKGTLSLAAGTVLNVADGGVVQIQGPVANAGTIALASSGSNTDLRILAAGATLSGGGLVFLSGPKARILGTSASATLTNFDTITGEGFIGLGSMTLVNEFGAEIAATAGGDLVLNTKGEVLVNSGHLWGLTGTLVLASTTIDQSGGGDIACSTGGTIKLEGDVVVGGTLFQSGSGVLEVNASGGKLQGVAISGVVQVLGGVSLTLDGAIDNQGKLDTLGGSKVTKLIVGADGVILSGGGQVNLSASVNNVITGAASSDTLTNVDNRIAGAGHIGAGSMKLVNQAKGVIVGNSAVTLTLDTGTNKIVNAGEIESAGSGQVVVKSALANSGLLFAANGTLTLDGAVTNTGTAEIKTGVLNIASAFAEAVTFLSGATGQLRLTDFADFGGTVSGLSHSGANSIDLAGFTLTGATVTYTGTTASGVLRVTNGTQTARIKLTGDYTGATFTLASDGAGGVLVKDPTGQAAPLAQAMAGFQEGPPPHLAGTPAYRLPRLPLLHARV